MLTASELEDRRCELIDQTAQVLADVVFDPNGLVASGYVASPSTSRAHQQAMQMASGIVHGAPAEVIMRPRRKRRMTNAEQERRVNAISTMMTTMDHPLSHDPSVVEALENTLLRIATARDAGIISQHKAAQMEQDIRRQIKRRAN